MRSHTKSFKYAGGRLVRWPRSRGGDVLAGEDGVATGGGGILTAGPLGSTSSASCPRLLLHLPPLHYLQTESVKEMEAVYSLVNC